MSSLLQLHYHLNINTVKNLLFDLGNVLVEVDPNRSAVEFQKLGTTNFELPPGDDFNDLETGKISPQYFRTVVRASMSLSSHVTDAQFDVAWGAPLLKFACGRLELIQQLRKNYKVYVLSNSDHILTESMNKICFRDYKKDSLDPFFEKVFYSHEIGHLKPDVEAFEHVIKDRNLVPSETLFMDDSASNIMAARSCGLQAVQVDIKTDLRFLKRK